MGRTTSGSYAELVTVPSSNVVPVSTSLSWIDLAALPEVYATVGRAAPEPGIRARADRAGRGATSSLGQAAVNVAAEGGTTVIAPTRQRARADLLRDIGAAGVLIDDGQLADQVQSSAPTWTAS